MKLLPSGPLAGPKTLGRTVLYAAVASVLIALAACSPAPAPSAPAPATPAAAAPAPAPAAPSFAPYAGTDKILVADEKTKKLTVHLVGAEGDAAKGMNFNGFANGDLQIQVPTGWKVTFSFTVGGGTMAHSALIVPWEQKDKPSHWKLAFPHAAVADYTSGIEAGDGAQKFTFTADKAGQYGLICGVAGHVAMGMWDEFDVVDGLPAPQVLVRS